MNPKPFRTGGTDRKDCDILLMFPTGNIKYGLRPSFTHTLGLGYINAFLRSKGFVSSVFLSRKTHLPLCVREILSLKPGIVGISVVDDNYVNSLLIAGALKKVYPSLVLVLGGPTPTVNHRYILNHNPAVDICVRGEGEEISYQLLRALSGVDFRFERADLSGIKGISYRNGHEIVINEAAHVLLENKGTQNYLDTYPSPYLTGVMPAAEAEHSGMVTARGCNQNCVYCNCAILYKRHVFTHSVARVLQELDLISRMSPTKAVNIFDDAFTLYPKRAEKICRGIIENGIKLRLTCLTRCDYLSESLLDLMKEAGFKTVSFSLESAVPRILRIIGKNQPPEDNPSDDLAKEARFISHVKAMAAYAKKIGMDVVVSVMLGLPTETPAEAAETLRYLNELSFDRYNHNFFRILQGTPIALDYKKYGYTLERVSKHQIKPSTIHPIDFSGIGYSRNSIQENIFRRNEKERLRVLGLLSKRETMECFFDNVILRSDVIDAKLIRWLQDNLALGGAILQIFSGEEKFEENRKSSLKMLLDHFSPSTKLTCYYIQKRENAEIWSRGKNLLFGGTPMEVLGSKAALERYSGGNGSAPRMLAMDLDRRDSRGLLDLLLRFEDGDACLDHLMSHQPYPVFTALCRWLRTGANCGKLETAILDEGGHIRLCWGGAPVGAIPDSARDIIENLKASKAALIKERGCARCTVEKTCMQCYFPEPLPVREYCRLMKNSHVREQAEAFKTGYEFADFFGIMGFEDIAAE